MEIEVGKAYMQENLRGQKYLALILMPNDRERIKDISYLIGGYRIYVSSYDRGDYTKELILELL